MDNRVARMCRYRSILRGTGQEKCYGEEKKRDSTYINLLKGFSSGGEDLVFGNCLFALFFPPQIPMYSEDY